MAALPNRSRVVVVDRVRLGPQEEVALLGAVRVRAAPEHPSRVLLRLTNEDPAEDPAPTLGTWVHLEPRGDVPHCRLDELLRRLC